MTGLSPLLYVGYSGLNAALEGMETVSNNTANANTPGYNVQSVSQSELALSGSRTGNGVSVSGIQRSFNQFIYAQLVQAGSANQAAQTVQTNAQNLATLFPVASGGANGLGAALTDFFSSVNLVAQDAASVPNRASLLSSAQALTADFNSVGSGLAANLASINQQVTSAVQQINQLASQIASANAAVVAQTAVGNSPPNSLLDNRDYLVQQLGQQVGTTIVQGADGSVNLYVAGGVALVNGATATTLAVGANHFGDGAVAITDIETGQDLSTGISGGTLGGLLSSSSQVVTAQDSLGALAVSLAAAVNAQQSLGLDLNGGLGTPIFSAAGPMVHPSDTNAGTGALTATISNGNAFTPADFVLTKTAAGFDATNLTTGQVTTLGAGPTLSLDGMTVTVSGAVAAGDSFKLEPTMTTAQSLAVGTNDPAAIAAGSAYVVTPGANAGNVVATTASPAASGSLGAATLILPATDFGQSLTVKFTSAGAFQVLDSSNAVLGSGSFSASNGAQIAIAYPSPPGPAGQVAVMNLGPGTPGAGDSFRLAPAGVGDNGNIVAMTGLATQHLLSGQSLSSAYAALVASVGTSAQSAGVAAQAAQAVLDRTRSVQQSISGVNLDEEAANLVAYQQAYQASATVIAAAQTLFQSLLNAVHGG